MYQQVYTAEIIINQVDSKTAELAKYIQNCFIVQGKAVGADVDLLEAVFWFNA